jgi:hypothetical protein
VRTPSTNSLTDKFTFRTETDDEARDKLFKHMKVEVA